MSELWSAVLVLNCLQWTCILAWYLMWTNSAMLASVLICCTTLHWTQFVSHFSCPFYSICSQYVMTSPSGISLHFSGICYMSYTQHVRSREGGVTPTSNRKLVEDISAKFRREVARNGKIKNRNLPSPPKKIGGRVGCYPNCKGGIDNRILCEKFMKIGPAKL